MTVTDNSFSCSKETFHDIRIAKFSLLKIRNLFKIETLAQGQCRGPQFYLSEIQLHRFVFVIAWKNGF